MTNLKDYGLYKRSYAMRGFWPAVRKFLPLRNRYLKFFSIANKSFPLLEIGCGDGAFLKILSNDGFVDVQGLEPSTSYAFSDDSLLIHNVYAHEFLADCYGHHFGTVVMMDVLEHIPIGELHSLLKQIKACLKPKGVLILRIPNMGSPLSLHNYFGDLTHVTGLNELSIRQLCFETGFILQSIKPEPFSYPCSLSSLAGIVFWPFYSCFSRIILSAFGISQKILTPNLVCILMN